MSGQFKIVHKNIVTVEADAIVNSASRHPICGGSTEACIYEAAGYEDLLAERLKIGWMNVCDVAVTPAFNLDAKYLIFVSAPQYNDGRSGEAVALQICYQRILEKAVELGCTSVAMPLLSSGAYRFPKDEALKIAKESIENFLENSQASLKVSLVIYGSESQKAAQELFGDIENYIRNYFEIESYAELGPSVVGATLKKGAVPVGCLAECSQRESLDERLRAAQNVETFRDRMNEWMRKRDITSTMLQRNADIDRRHFSKINSDKKYKMTKGTAIAIAVGLQLNYDDAVELLALAGFALSPSSRADLIVRYFFENKKKFFREKEERNQYTVAFLNDILTSHGEEVIGYSKNIHVAAG